VSVQVDADLLAVQCVDTMWAEDGASQAMGMQIVSVREGCAVVSMTVRETMVNGHGMCHGGMIFSLADSAFAFACNSQNLVAVASGACIDYLRPAFTGNELTASASVVNQGKKNGLYDVVVSDQDNRIIAQFRGRSARIRGAVLPE
jgi:acyl-CoA thioesterase